MGLSSSEWRAVLSEGSFVFVGALCVSVCVCVCGGGVLLSAVGSMPLHASRRKRTENGDDREITKQ